MKRILVAIAVASSAVLLALACWGFGNLASFPDQPARVAACASLWLWLVAMWSAKRQGPSVESQEDSQRLFTNVNGMLMLLTMAAFPLLDSHGWLQVEPSWIRWLGVGLLSAGAFLHEWSRMALGEWFSPQIVIKQGHEIVEGGPYRMLRHPIYTAFMMIQAGYGAAFGSWAEALVVLAQGVVLAFRIPAEERLLEAKFGDRYREFSRRRYRLIPFLF